MKYFTRERHLAMQVRDPAAADAADAAWEEAVEHYEAALTALRPTLPEGVRRLLDGFHFHDARVLSMGQRGEEFVISLQLDVPPQEVVTLSYTLTGEPTLRKEPFAWGGQTLLWLYDEVEQPGAATYVHSVLFGNGWELALPFREVRSPA